MRDRTHPRPASLLPACSHCSAGDSFPLHADAEARTRIYTERLALVRARLMRNPLFTPPLLESLRTDHLPLTPVDQLPRAVNSSGGSNGVSLTLLGLLTQPEVGLWCLEDERGRAIALDLSSPDCKRIPGFYTETAIVLVQGVYDPEYSVADSVTGRVAGSASDGGGVSALLSDNRLPGAMRVTLLSHPPSEERGATLLAMGIVDPLRHHKTPADVARATMLMRDPGEAGTMIAVLADVHLDSPVALSRLRAVLEGFNRAGSVPPLFVLMGNFGSTAFGQLTGDRVAWRARFDGLAHLLSEFSNVAASTHFVLIPGPHDPGSGGALPRPPLPASFASALLDTTRLPALTLASNPCRIRHYAQEYVFFRADVTTRLRRRTVLPPLPPPSEDFPVTNHTVRTIVDQSHLLPLPIATQPVYWALDHALRLAPTPDVIVVAEEQEPYATTSNGCLVVNPGSFAAAEGEFAVIRPTGGADSGPAAELSCVSLPDTTVIGTGLTPARRPAIDTRT